MIRTYTELIQLPTLEERYKYLRLNGRVGEDTFGFDRWINQAFYKSGEWLDIRDYVISRDCGCDLGILEQEIPEGVPILVHHMNPVKKDDILRKSKFLIDPEYLITTIARTHRAIHYGDDSLLLTNLIERSKNDTCPWKH